MKLKKTLRFSLILFSLYFIFDSTYTVFVGLNDDVSQADFIVILGNQVQEDGTLSARLKARLDRSLEIYKDSPTSVIVSGGLGKEGFWEGSKMAQYLIDQGIDSIDITIDNYGNTTMLTAQNSLQWIKPKQNIVLVSQFYHLRRTKLAFEKMGFVSIQTSHCSYFEMRDFYSLFREFFAIWKYRLA